MRFIIIGGGVSGICAAIEAARLGARVTVIDRNARPLKKLCVTGNGRGNLMNENELAYYGDADFARKVLERVPRESVRAFLGDAGVTLATDAEGRVYPAALMASVVAEALLARARRCGVELIADARVTELMRLADGSFEVRCLQAVREGEKVKKSGKQKQGAIVGEKPLELRGERVMAAVGGAASPAHGTDGSGYALLTALGHTLTPVRPALCALLTDTAPLYGLSGQRARARLRLLAGDGALLHESEGEALFCDDGVSGIAAMQLARFVQSGCKLSLDLRRAVIGNAEADAAGWLRERTKRLCGGASVPSASELLLGAASPALSRALMRQAGVACEGRSVSDLRPEELDKLASAITAFTLSVAGTRGFEQAQVTAGGVRASEFDPASMQSRVVPHLYAAGEVLDVDGDCGGYNLLFAFASGMLAGRSAV